MVSRVENESKKVQKTRSTHRVKSKTSRRNSPGDPFHVGENSVALRRPVSNISEITNIQTDTHTRNPAINVIDIHYYVQH